MSRLPIIGIPVVEHCNLNCKGCLHFCHIGQKPYFYNIHVFASDFRRLKMLFDDVGIVRFYGGEPFLHKDLEQFIKVACKQYPYAKLEIFTNGILLRKIPETLIKTIIHYKVKIFWSVYPVTDNRSYMENINWLKKNKILYRCDKVNEFYACFDLTGRQNKTESFDKCNGRHCHMLRNGKISCCPAPLVAHYVNQLGANIDFDDGALDIYEAASGEDVLTFLHEPHTACKYCGPPRYFKWEKQNEDVTLRDWQIVQ